jgi:hypothetical protein
MLRHAASLAEKLAGNKQGRRTPPSFISSL